MMAYFNGSLHGYNSSQGFIAPVPITEIYCDACAPEAIPFDKTKPAGREHWNTGFRWCPVFGGDEKCHFCGKPV